MKEKLIKLTVIILLMIGIHKIAPSVFYVIVKADTTDNWYFNISHYGSGNFNYINHTSNGVNWLTNTTRDVSFNIGWTTGTESDIYLDYYLPTHNTDVTIANNGVSLSYFTDLSLRQGYLYNINSYFCANSSINSTTGQTRVGYSASNAYQANYDYSSTNITQLGNVLRGRTSSDNLYNCVLYSSLVVPSANGSWVNIKITNSSSLSDRRLYFIGYDIRELGIYSDTVRNIIQNSGIATAQSIQQVQSAVNQVEQQMDDVNDTLTEDHTYNNNASTNLPGNNEIDNLTDAEDELFNNIDLSGVEDLNITINPNANNFIWEIVNQLRQMNTNIILLITSALGLGIIKMILNR